MGFLYMWLHNGQQCWGEVVLTKRELHNVVDRYAVAVKKHSGKTIGHLPRLCNMFIEQGGNI